MKIDLNDKQLSDIQYAICIAMAHTEKNSNLPRLMKIKPEEHPLIKRCIETYDQIAEVRRLHKVNNSWIKALQGEEK